MSKSNGSPQAQKVAKAQRTDEMPKRMGRPRGKASDPDWRQVTVYLRRITHTAARKRLLDEDGDFSDLVQDLLTKWLGTARRKE